MLAEINRYHTRALGPIHVKPDSLFIGQFTYRFHIQKDSRRSRYMAWNSLCPTRNQIIDTI